MPLPLVLRTIYDQLKIHFKQTSPLIWIHDEPTKEDLDHLIKQGEATEFDTANLKKSMLDDLRKGKAKLITKSCAIAKVLVVAYPEQEEQIPWKIIGNIFRAFGRSPSKTDWRVVWFANPVQRTLPQQNMPVEATHLNGGYTMRCQPSTIVVYREEEFLRVLVHELLHAACTDSIEESIELIEAKTESWAELFLVAILCIERTRALNNAWATQAQWIADQEYVMRNEYGVNSPADYAWRYTVGRRFVLEGLCVELPEPSANPRATIGNSSRFTAPLSPN